MASKWRPMTSRPSRKNRGRLASKLSMRRGHKQISRTPFHPWRCHTLLRLLPNLKLPWRRRRVRKRCPRTRASWPLCPRIRVSSLVASKPTVRGLWLSRKRRARAMEELKRPRAALPTPESKPHRKQNQKRQARKATLVMFLQGLRKKHRASRLMTSWSTKTTIIRSVQTLPNLRRIMRWTRAMNRSQASIKQRII